MKIQEMKPGWKVYRFDQIAINVNERVEPGETDLEHYVGLEHLDGDSLKIRRWGTPDDVDATKLLFQTGDIIFGRRRVYQRKLAVAEFDGICSAHAMVLRPRLDVVLPEFLPFFMQSDLFMNRAMEISVGSLSPTINWKTLARQEFALPPLAEQRRIAEVLCRLQDVVEHQRAALEAIIRVRDSAFLMAFSGGFQHDFDSIAQLNDITDARLPPGWGRVAAASLSAAPVTKGATPQKELLDVDTGIPFVKVYNLTFDGSLDFTLNPTYISKKGHHDLQRSIVLPGDVLINIVGPPLGKISLVPDNFPESNINQAIARYRPINSMIGQWLSWYLQSQWAQTWFHVRSKKTSGQRNLTLELCRNIPVPIPPEHELEAICGKIQQIEDCFQHLEKRGRQHRTLYATILADVL